MKNLIIALLLTLAMVFSGCFNITEKIKFNKNGSGEVTTTVDMSQMMTMIMMLMPEMGDSIQDMFNMDDFMNEDYNRYDGIDGISNVSSKKEDEYKFSISYNFANMNALNKAMAVKGTGSEETGLSSMDSEYKFKRRRFCRTTNYSKDENSAMDEFDMEENKSLMEMVNAPTYTIEYELPRTVKKVNVKGEKSSVDHQGNKVTIEYNLLDFMSADGEIMNHDLKF